MRSARLDGRWLGGASLLTLAMGACTLAPTPPFQPESAGVGGTPYNPPSATPPEQIDNDAGQLIGTRGTDAGGYEAGPRSAGDAATPSMDDAAPPLVDSAQPLGVSDTGSPQSDDASASQDAAPDPDASAQVPTSCPGPLGAGDLAVVELMIASQVSGGDMGQWIEVQSTRSCTLDLYGLHAAASMATSPSTMDVTSHTYLPPSGIFVIANSLDPTLDDNLPTAPLLFGWAGSPADVLQTAGGSVTLSNAGTGAVIDDFVYPEFQALIVGASISFPADCAWSDRADWGRWSFSTRTWFSTFQGTPNAPNTDVTCY
jgi:hypothetical protein